MLIHTTPTRTISILQYSSSFNTMKKKKENISFLLQNDVQCIRPFCFQQNAVYITVYLSSSIFFPSPSPHHVRKCYVRMAVAPAGFNIPVSDRFTGAPLHTGHAHFAFVLPDGPSVFRENVTCRTDSNTRETAIALPACGNAFIRKTDQFRVRKR